METGEGTRRGQGSRKSYPYYKRCRLLRSRVGASPCLSRVGLFGNIHGKWPRPRRGGDEATFHGCFQKDLPLKGKGMPLLYSEGVCTVYSRGSPCGYPGPCGCLPLFPSSGMTRFIRHRYKIWDESCPVRQPHAEEDETNEVLTISLSYHIAPFRVRRCGR